MGGETVWSPVYTLEAQSIILHERNFLFNQFPSQTFYIVRFSVWDVAVASTY